jgi:hypothetical protein
MVAINSLSPSVNVEGPRKRNCVNSRIGARCIFLYSSKPVMPGRCSSNGIYGIVLIVFFCIRIKMFASCARTPAKPAKVSAKKVYHSFSINPEMMIFVMQDIITQTKC